LRPRILKIMMSVSGFPVAIASVHIQKFADVLKADTVLVCPNCGKEPKYHGGYDCECGSRFGHWSQLKRVLKNNGEEVKAERFTSDGVDVEGQAFAMDVSEFAKYVDATAQEYGVSVEDEVSAKNLKKLLIATKNLNKVILIRFKDTYEERVAILTTSISERIILKDLIPLNLLDLRETMKVSLKEVSPEELAEAESFVKQIPIAKEEMLSVSDYRTKGITKEKVSPKVMELEAVLAKAKAKQQATA